MREILVAEFDAPEPFVEAARHVRGLGHEHVDAFSPFPIPELDEALATRRTRLPRLVFAGGLFGGALAFAFQWWANGIDYPLDVGGRPTNSIPTHVLIVFELTVLFAAIAAFVGVLVGSKLPRLHDPVFDLPNFERTSEDRYWIVVGDLTGASGELGRALERLGATSVRTIGAAEVEP